MTDHNECIHDCSECTNISVDVIREEIWCDIKEKIVGSIRIEYGETWLNFWENENN